MNIKQIGLDELFLFDTEQIKEKKIIMKTYHDLIVKSHKYNFDLSSIKNWFNFFLSNNYNSLEEICQNIAEDICILAKINNQYKLIYINVAFPNRWRPTEKIDKNIAEIHNPVPNFLELSSKIDNFLEIIEENVPYRRQNWGFAKSNDLYLPYDKDDNDGLYLRKEIQTIVKINNFILFMIKTNVHKSTKNILERYSSNLSNEMKDYKLLSKI